MNYFWDSIKLHQFQKPFFLVACLSFFIFFSPVIKAQEFLDYEIKEGDCLWTIAQKFQLSIQDVTEVNDLDEGQILQPGYLIRIPKNGPNQEIDNSSIIVHRVQKGESLWEIAQQYRLSLDCISSANQLSSPDSLYIGQEIKIPLDSSQSDNEQMKDIQSKLSYESSKEKLQGMSTSLNQQFRESLKDEINYAVKPGESLWTIAQNYQISLNELSAVNDLENAEHLSVGQIIKIPLGNNTREDEGRTSDKNISLSYVEHIVEAGESISIIAQKYHVPVDDIFQLNNITQRDYVYPGQRIIVKSTEQYTREDYPAIQQSENEFVQKQEDQTKQEPIYYTVNPGDTLWTIAQKYSVSIESILAVNYLNNKNVLIVGQKLEIPAIGGIYHDNAEQKTIEYTVVQGDSLWNIAQKFDVRMTDIININQLQNITQLSIGQKIDIPATEKVMAQMKSGGTNTVNPTTEEKKDIVHYVQKGETLWEISRKYQVSLQAITSANHISENSRIVVGQRLVIPGGRGSHSPSRSYVWPLKGLITSQYGIRTLGGRRDYHTGIDIDGHTGASIRAAENGKVSFSGYINGYGNVVIVDHAGGISTVYAHNSANLVKEGQIVSRGDIIARVGSTGNSTGSHLHFEIRENGKPINPINYLP